MIDYLFYKVYSFYKKKNDPSPILMGCLVLSVFTGLTLLSIISVLGFFINIVNLKLILLITFLISLVIFWRHFGEERIKSIKNVYEFNEKENRYTIFFIVYFIVVLSIPIAIGFLRHNLEIKI